jgi:predicted transcriptional regulator
MKTTAISTRLPEDLALQLDEVCDVMGFKKNRLIEIALREKLEELLDAQDLNEAVSEETGFTGLDDARAALLGGD